MNELKNIKIGYLKYDIIKTRRKASEAILGLHIEDSNLTSEQTIKSNIYGLSDDKLDYW